MVSFNRNLFCLFVLAFLPAVVEGLDKEVAVSATMELEAGDDHDVKLLMSASVDNTATDYLVGSAEDTGSFQGVVVSEEPVDVPGGGTRKLGYQNRRLQVIQFEYNAAVAIQKLGPAPDKITVTFNVNRVGSTVSIPISLTITANGGVQTVAMPLFPLAARSKPDPPGRLTVVLAGLRTVSDANKRFVSYEFLVIVKYVAKNKLGLDLLYNYQVVGDPHFRTWSGERFDYQGQCELALIRAPLVDLAVHIRTKIRDSYSYIESLALGLGDDILEVSSYGEYFFNGVESAKLPATMSSFPLKYEKNDKNHSTFVIDLDFGQQMTIYTIKDIVNVKVANATGVMFANSGGLMGTFGSGKHLARDGLTIIKDPIAFSHEWQVLDSEPKLFQSSLFEPQHPSPCILPDTVALEARRRLLEESVSRAVAEDACAHANGQDKENCVYDVMVTGDLDMATNY